MARKVTFNKVKFEERLLQQINLLLRREFKDPRLVQVTITSVELTNDYSYAKVMWDTFDKSKRGDAKAALDGITGKLRSKLAAVMEVRHTPIIQFEYNSQFESEFHISQILRNEAKKSAENNSGEAIVENEMDEDLEDDDDFDDDEEE
ncbi:MAG: 30S ribosome-binding factor RbfA [Bacteriovoracaceae bacterium]